MNVKMPGQFTAGEVLDALNLAESRRLLGLRGAAARLGVSEADLRQLVAEELVPHVLVDRKPVFEVGVLLKWQLRNAVAIQPPGGVPQIS